MKNTLAIFAARLTRPASTTGIGKLGTKFGDLLRTYTGIETSEQTMLLLRRTITQKFQPVVAQLNQIVAKDAQQRRFYLTITQRHNVEDHASYLRAAIGHFSHKEHAAADFFNQNPLKQFTPDHTFNAAELGKRSFGFDVATDVKTTYALQQMGTIRFTKGTASGVRLTNNFDEVIDSAVAYFKNILGRPIELYVPTNSKPSRPLPLGSVGSELQPRR